MAGEDDHLSERFNDAVAAFLLDEEAARIGWPGMHEKLAALDPETAARLKPNDAQRIQRALEIIELSGKPMSALLAQHPQTELPFELLPIALEPSDRSVLHARIAARFDAMLEGGALMREVETLRARGDLHQVPRRPAAVKKPPAPVCISIRVISELGARGSISSPIIVTERSGASRK